MMRHLLSVGCLLSLLAPLHGDETTELKAYLRALKTGAASEKIRAAQDIAKLGPDAAAAIPALCEAVVDTNSKIGVAALEALEKVDPNLHKLITTLLVDKDERKRSNAMQDISQLENVEATVPILIAHVRARVAKEDDFFGVPGDISRAIDSLQSVAAKNPALAKVLIDASGPANPRHKNRSYAMKALGEIAEHHEKSIPQIKKTLTAGLADRNAETRTAALTAIGKLGAQAKELAPTVKKFKLDPDAKVREAANEALEKIQGK